MATSAQKRKWRRQSQKLTQPYSISKSNIELLGGMKGMDSHSSSSASSLDWRPIFFLGVFPFVMSCIVVILRDDLREELEEKGIARFLRDIKQWRTVRAIELEEKQRAPKEKEPDDQR
jgi:hypothetical protein